MRPAFATDHRRRCEIGPEMKPEMKKALIAP
jgi:hypothetical protein